MQGQSGFHLPLGTFTCNADKRSGLCDKKPLGAGDDIKKCGVEWTFETTYGHGYYNNVQIESDSLVLLSLISKAPLVYSIVGEVKKDCQSL